MTETQVELTIEEPGWEVVPDLAGAATTAATLALQGAGLSPAEYSISVLACSDSRIQGLNTEFRDKAAPTNVLSWPAYDLAPAAPGEAPPTPPDPPFDGPNPIGDVAIALQTCIHEAKIAEIPLKNHVIHLILHGSLHLLGFDHETDKDAARMEGIESQALAKLGIADPYAQRKRGQPVF